MLLNGGGVGQLQEVVKSFSTAFSGRAQQLRSLIDQLERFVSLCERSDRRHHRRHRQSQQAGRHLRRAASLCSTRRSKTIPEALTVLKDERANLVEAIDKLGEFSALAADSVNQTKENLVNDPQRLHPVLKSLADAGPALTRSLSMLTTFPFPFDTLDNWFRGDYGNLTAVFDLTLSRLDAAMFTGTRFEGDLTQVEMQWGRTIGQMPSPYTSANPLVAPYHLDQGP